MLLSHSNASLLSHSNASTAIEILFAEFNHVTIGDAVTPHELFRRSRLFNQIHDHKQRVHAALRVAFLVLLPVFKILESDAQGAPLLRHSFNELANLFLRAVARAVKKEDVVICFIGAIAIAVNVNKQRHPVLAVFRVRVRVENDANFVRACIHVFIQAEVAELLPHAHARRLGRAIIARRRPQKLKRGKLVLVLFHNVFNIFAAKPLVRVTDPRLRGFRGKRVFRSRR